MDTQQVKILYLIQLPPPVHGVSTINSIIYNSPVVNSGIQKLLLELKFSDSLSQLRRFNLSKITRFLSLTGKLRKTLRSEQPDFVYFSAILVGKGFWRDLLLVRIIKRSGSKPIYHLHNRGISRNSNRPLFRALYRYVLNNSVVIHLSDKLLEQEIIPIRKETTRVFAVPNGIPDILLHQQSHRIPAEQHLSVLFVSNLFEEKGIFDLLKIMSGVRKTRSDIRLKISGEFLRPGIKQKLLRAIEEEGLGDIIELHNPVYDEAKDLAFIESDIFIFPSYFRMECFPLVILEAMSHSLPVISSDIGAITEMIESGKDGIIVLKKDIDGFVSALLQLADDPALREELGLAGRNKFLEKYTSSHLENNIREVIETCIKENK